MNVLRVFIAIFILLISFGSQAGNNDKCEVRPVYGFEFTMSIHKYKPNKKYILKIEVDDDYWESLDIDDVLLWSNSTIKDDDLSAAIFYDDSLIQNKNYELGFKYIKTSSSDDVVHGELTYYRKLEGDSWKEIDSKPLFLSFDKSDVELDVKGKNRANLNCQGTIPDIIDPTPPTPTFNNFCEYFPEPAQGWITESSDSILTMTNSGANSGLDSDSYIHGWSSGFISTNTTSTNFNGKSISILKTGFDKTTDQWQLYNSGDSCESSACSVGDDAQVDTRKATTPTLITPDFSSNATLNFNGGDYKTQCVGSSLCSYSIDPTSGSDLVEITGNLFSLNIGGQSAGHLIVEFQDGISIKSFTSQRGGTNVELKFLENSTITFGEFVLGGGSGNSFTFGDMAWINVVTSWRLDNMVTITTSNPVVIYAPNASFSVSSGQLDFYGYILAKRVTFSSPITIHGSVTSNDLIMNRGVKIIGDGSCSPSPPLDTTYTLKLTPDNQFALLCQTPEVTYTVYNEDGTIATDYPGTITATYPSGLAPLDATVGSKNSNYVYKPTNGVVTVPVKADTIKEYSISAELTGDSSATDSGSILFWPYKFDVEPVKAVAGHPTQFNVQVLACKDDKVTPVKGYSGDKNLTVSNINLTKPTIAEGAREGVFPQVSDSENGSYSSTAMKLNFSKDAKSSSYLKYAESGSLTFMLVDSKFVCPADYDGCDIAPDGDGTDGGDGTDSDSFSTLQGLVNVDVRPWTFAICDANNKPLPSGNSKDGDPFISAGTPFSLHVKPVVWQSGGSLTDPVDVSGYCDADITQNFFVTDAPTAIVQVNSELDTPKSGRLNGGLIFNNDIDKSGAERKHDAGVGSGIKQHYDYDDVRWREVGSITATADTLGNYLGMDINLGYRNIGRFYPHRLEIESNQWKYEDKDHGHVGYSGFAYMNQPFPMEYTVVAVNKNGEETQNYGFFDSSLQDELALTAINNDNGQSLLNRLIYTNQSTNGWSDLLTNGKTTERNAQYVVNYDDFEFLKKLGSNPNNSEYTSTSDGPYDSSNAKFGVAVIKKVDDVDFDFTSVDSGDKITLDADGDGTVDIGLKFTLQPDFRYGRMALDSVSGPIGGPINVPLRVEYWDGSSFITNTDDSGSEFKTRVYYVMSNLQDSSAKFSDVGTSKVTNGKSSVLKAEQANSQRETVRLFLRQGNDSTGYENSPKPADDPDLKETIKGWNEPVEDIGQPWLQFNWRNLGDEDPSTVVIFGAYRGNDRIIYRGEPNLTAN